VSRIKGKVVFHVPSGKVVRNHKFKNGVIEGGKFFVKRKKDGYWFRLGLYITQSGRMELLGVDSNAFDWYLEKVKLNNDQHF
jgi:hypothetical protein